MVDFYLKYIKIEVIEKPDWCTASIESDSHTFSITPEIIYNVPTILSIQLNYNAPAFESFKIKIKAYSTPILGVLEKRIILNSTKTDGEINLEVGYLPIVKFIWEASRYNLSPMKENIIPIKFENVGNGLTNVKLEIGTAPDNWEIKIDPELIISAGEIKEINLSVNPGVEFNHGTIELNYTPRYNDDLSIHGGTHSAHILFFNDTNIENSNKEIPGFEIQYLILTITIFIFVKFKNKYNKK